MSLRQEEALVKVAGKRKRKALFFFFQPFFESAIVCYDDKVKSDKEEPINETQTFFGDQTSCVHYILCGMKGGCEAYDH